MCPSVWAYMFCFLQRSIPGSCWMGRALSEDEFESIPAQLHPGPHYMKIMPNILSTPGGKYKQAHGLCGFDVSGSVPSLEELTCMYFGGTNAKDCFSALNGMSRSGFLYGSAGPAAFKKPWVCPGSLDFLLFPFSALES